MGKQKIADSETGDRSAELPGDFFGSVNQKSEKSRFDSRVISGGRKGVLGIPKISGRQCAVPLDANASLEFRRVLLLAYVEKGRYSSSGRAGKV